MKKSEMTGIQKTNYEYLRSLGIKKSWAKRLVGGKSDYSDEIICAGEPVNDIVLGFDSWSDTKEGSKFWVEVEDDCHVILREMSYHQALLEIPNNLVKKSE